MLISSQTRLVLLILVLVTNIWLVVLVYKYSKNRLLSSIFLLLSCSLAGWIVSVYLALHPSLPQYSTFFPRVSMAFGVGLAAGALLLTYVLVNNTLLPKKYLYLCGIFSLFLIPLTLSPFVFKYVPPSTSSSVVAITGWGMYFYSAYTIIVSVAAVYILIYGAKRASALQRKQLLLVLSGLFGMIAAFIFTVMLPILFFNNANFVQFGGFYILFFLLCVALAILKYQLFNIKFIAVEALAILLNSFLLIRLVGSASSNNFIINGLVLIATMVISYLVIKSNKKEIYQHGEQIRISALEESNSKLQELDRQKTEFLTIAAHQLRTPVSIINNYIAMLQDGDYGKLEDEAKAVLTNMDASNQWLVRLADEFLNIANLEQGQTKYHLSPADLGKITMGVIAALMPKAAVVGAKINFKRPSEPIIANCDEEKIRVCILNFVDNAVKYGQLEGGKPAIVTISIIPENHGFSVMVTDQGIGFSSEDHGILFQKFSRGQNTKRHEVNTSTGLGLYITRKFIEGHGGKVWAKSEGPNRGSEFGFWLPQNDPKT